tara:strand:- start:1039 stop:2088 length:1050 start_codon:yes stop_codon:yes gene_type:complete
MQTLIEAYRSFLPVPADARIISIAEGGTPLIPLTSFSLSDRGISVYAKCEGMNPTGSFKDRGMTVAVTMSLHAGAKAIICASTGNTSASAAAYAARAGIQAFVVIPDGQIAQGKLAQAMMHGAKVIQISGDFDDGMAIVRSLAAETDIALVNSVNPHRLAGQKTAAFEIVDVLGSAPDYHFLPVGNAGNISAYWLGYNEYLEAGRSNQRPRMVGCQASGAAPFVSGNPVERPETVATAIRIGRPQSWDLARAAQQESRGWFLAFSDEEILSAQRDVAERDGIFCEPASAVCLAGVRESIHSGVIPDGSVIVCTLTGHGLKDPDTAIAQSPVPTRVRADATEVRAIIWAD